MHLPCRFLRRWTESHWLVRWLGGLRVLLSAGCDEVAEFGGGGDDEAGGFCCILNEGGVCVARVLGGAEVIF